MPVDATTSTQNISSAQVAQSTNNAQNASSNKTSDASFEQEMNKISDKNKETKTETDTKKENSTQAEKTKENNKQIKLGKENTTTTSIEEKQNLKTNNNNDLFQTSLAYNQISFNNANEMLTNDIAQVIETNSTSLEVAKSYVWNIYASSDNSKNHITMNETDAQFFINLTQDNNISMQSIEVQAQNMLNSGAEVSEVDQNVKVSQALLNALSDSRQNNQPIRIDFDQNISVILRVNRDGSISANFIPGDKAVEQYLKSNIELLRNSFDEQELKYSELTYSNNSKEQNRKQKQESNKQQGE